MGKAEEVPNHLTHAVGEPGRTWWWRVPDAVLAVVLASRCAACDGLLDEPTRGAVCAACWAAVRSFSPPICDGCGDPLPSWRTISQHQLRCARCRRAARAVDRSRALGPYEGTLRRIIHAFKYDGRRTLAAPIAALMRDRAADLLQDADSVVPVPLHWTRRRARGLNQALDLAHHLGPPVIQCLRRSARTASQTDLPAARRHANVREAFTPASTHRLLSLRTAPHRIGGSCVVLVDDVSTTGATLESCARVLKAEGAREVCALTAARSVARRP